MSVSSLLYILAFVCFLLAAFGARPGLSWRDLGFAFITLSFIVR